MSSGCLVTLCSDGCTTKEISCDVVKQFLNTTVSPNAKYIGISTAVVICAYLILLGLFVFAWTDKTFGKICFCGCTKGALRVVTIVIYVILVFSGIGLSIVATFGSDGIVSPFIDNFLLPWSIGTTVVNNLFLVPTIVLKYLSRKASKVDDADPD